MQPTMVHTGAEGGGGCVNNCTMGTGISLEQEGDKNSAT